MDNEYPKTYSDYILELGRRGDKIDQLQEENKKLRKTLLFVRDECDWETPRGDFGGGGDDRIGPAITSALANARGQTCGASAPDKKDGR